MIYNDYFPKTGPNPNFHGYQTVKIGFASELVSVMWPQIYVICIIIWTFCAVAPAFGFSRRAADSFDVRCQGEAEWSP